MITKAQFEGVFAGSYGEADSLSQEFESLKSFAFTLFSDFKSQLEGELPDFKVSWCFEHYQFYISILITDAPLDRPDLVELTVNFEMDSKGGTSLVCDVIWGDGNGFVEASAEASLQSERSFSKIRQELPLLIKVLGDAAIRGTPSCG